MPRHARRRSSQHTVFDWMSFYSQSPTAPPLRAMRTRVFPIDRKHRAAAHRWIQWGCIHALVHNVVCGRVSGWTCLGYTQHEKLDSDRSMASPNVNKIMDQVAAHSTHNTAVVGDVPINSAPPTVLHGRTTAATERLAPQSRSAGGRRIVVLHTHAHGGPHVGARHSMVGGAPRRRRPADDAAAG